MFIEGKKGRIQQLLNDIDISHSVYKTTIETVIEDGAYSKVQITFIKESDFINYVGEDLKNDT